MAAGSKSRLTTLAKPVLSRLVMALVILALIVAVFRHYQPPNREVAFPKGEIVIGVDATYPPFAVDNGGALRGLDIDLGIAIADYIELPVRFLNIGFYGLYDALLVGDVDLLISALQVEPARMEDVRYTQPYFDNGLVLVTASNWRAIDISNLAGARIAFEYASSSDSQARAWEREGHSIEKLVYELPSHALDALSLNQADGALVDATTFHAYLKAGVDWQAIHRYITHEPFAIAVRIDRVDAWELIERALSALKDMGELDRIIDKWLGSA